MPPDRQDVVVREADAVERSLAAFLLPRSLAHSSLGVAFEPAVFVALSADGRRMLGAAALACAIPPAAPAAAPLDVFVLENERRRGLGRRLVNEAGLAARRWGAPTLASWGPVEEGSEAGEACRRLGFRGRVSMRRFRCDAEALWCVVAPLWRRGAGRKGGAMRFRLAPAAQAPRTELLALQRLHLGAPGEAIQARLDSGEYAPEVAVAAMLPDGRVGGLMLCRWTDQRTVHVDTKVVAPELRGSMVNVALMHDALQAARSRGARWITFEAGEAHRDTARLAERAGGEAISSLWRYVRDL